MNTYKLCALKLIMTYYTKINDLHNNINKDKAKMMNFIDTNDINELSSIKKTTWMHNFKYNTNSTLW